MNLKCFFISCTIVFVLPATSSFSQKQNYLESKITIVNAGWELRGDLLLVKSKTKSPVVLLLNKANGDRQSYQLLAKLLAELNISSLRLDLRGHGESVNQGKFNPFDSLNNIKIDLDKTYTDIIAAHQYMLKVKQVDTSKIGIVGASYSGEEMMLASKTFKLASCYVALSPGSFSTESMNRIDNCNANMLFIKSMEERSMQGVEKDIFASSKKAQVLIVSGKNHATDILLAHPEISGMIADWLKRHL